MAGRRGRQPLKALSAPAADYEVGYGKPPKGTRFQPGQSGNPRGRPKGSKNRHDRVGVERLKKIVLEEFYREIAVSDGTRMVKVPVAQAVVRTMAVKAAKGDHRSQRLFSEMLWEIEEDRLAEDRDKLMTAVCYKERCHQEITRRQQRGLPPPLILPHPDDVVIDWGTGGVKVTGPVTREQLEIWRRAWNENASLEEFMADLQKRLAAARNPKRKAALSGILKRVEKEWSTIHRSLPKERYESWNARYPAEGELVEIRVPR
jgi:hypothetical protein